MDRRAETAEEVDDTLPVPQPDTTLPQRLTATQQDAKDVTEYLATAEKQAHALFKEQKGLLGKKKKLAKLEQPIALLRRNWGSIEVYTGVKGNVFVVPPAAEHQKVFGKELATQEPGKRRIYFSNRDMHTLEYGGETLRCFLFDEDDAMPMKADPKVWSERLEFTLDAILVNYEKLKAQLAAGKHKWIVQLVLYIGLFVMGYLIIKAIWPAAKIPLPGATETVTTALPDLPENVSRIINIG